MKKIVIPTIFWIVLVTNPLSAFATKTPSMDLIQKFVGAYESARKPMTTAKEIDNYLSFMSDNITDYHAAYGVTIKGKEKPRIGMLKKAQERTAFNIKVEDIILGSSTAVLVLTEDSKYTKNGKMKHFKGRTIFILEFNENGLIHHMRRYQDFN